ncbi:RNA polymerase sigma factor [Engelhardtia mirabilis]|uniref:RNA polymerase sigma factor n=1 Tax=Engelhardtia mirabilis TaxID=2528011 RepID=A0A518BEN0_9BACT|nr:RNA polymerase sigma factor [Planctomycetes bacterium Pla133]QDU99764.1 RNA polymerase sigma factor [Planctomycetes bacterium Pla86]
MDQPPPGHETLDLLHQAQGGDRAALEQALARCYPHVRRIVHERLGPGLRRYAESGDVVQEAMGAVVRGYDRFEARDDDALVRWIARLVENRIRDLAKHHGRAKRNAGPLVALDGGDGSDSAPGFDPARSSLTPLEKVAEAESAARVQLAITALEPRHRDVIRARNEGRTWAEVAEHLQLASEGAARMLHARAMVALMERVGHDDE